MTEATLSLQVGDRVMRLRGQSDIMARAVLAGTLGISFGGKRDLYEAAGFDKAITYAHYLARYLRQGMARRLVNVKPDETWRVAPHVHDGPDHHTDDPDSDFSRAWAALAYGGAQIEGETRRGLLHYLHRLDRLCGIGEYGVLLFGLADGLPLSESVVSGSMGGPEDLLYVNVLDAGSAVIQEYEADVNSRRFGRPKFYNLTLVYGQSQATHRVHWSRVIHVADEVVNNELFARPRLEPVWNDLVSLEKIMAATGEAGWQLMDPGRIITTKDGYQLPTIRPGMSQSEVESTEQAISEQTAQIEEWMHGLRRWLQLEGQEMQELTNQLQDPSPSVDKLLDLIAGSVGIPKRVLLGSERGEQASSQDEQNWNRVITTRQNNFAGPQILLPVLNRLTWYGILPKPSSGGFFIHWHPLGEQDRREHADIAKTNAEALSSIGAAVDPVQFVKTYMPDLPDDAVRPKEDVEPDDDSVQTLAAQIAANPLRALEYRWYP